MKIRFGESSGGHNAFWQDIYVNGKKLEHVFLFTLIPANPFGIMKESIEVYIKTKEETFMGFILNNSKDEDEWKYFDIEIKYDLKNDHYGYEEALKFYFDNIEKIKELQK